MLMSRSKCRPNPGHPINHRVQNGRKEDRSGELLTYALENCLAVRK